MGQENIAEAKKEIRRRILAQRKDMSPEEVAARSERVTRHLKGLPQLMAAGTLMGYAPFANEVDIMPFLLERQAAGVRVFLPRVIKDRVEIEAVPLMRPEDMLPGSYGIKEPEGEAVDPGEIEAVIVPGVAFDRQGYRLGYGKGYYDRFLVRLKPGVVICAVAFNLQMVEALPRTNTDYRLPLVVTEEGVMRTG